MSDIKPWDLKTDSVRNADTVYNFIIFCEDDASEPAYLRWFENNKVKISLLTNKQGKRKQELIVWTKLEEDNQIEYNEGKLIGLKFDEGTQVWCVYDRDKDTTTSRVQDDMDFTTSITNLEHIGVKVAWSNDAFELWILLHFEDVDINDEKYKNRATYYDRLTHIFKSMPDPNEQLKKKLAHASFGYKKDLKGGKEKEKGSFFEIVLPAIKDKIPDAIKRAEELENYHRTNHKYHDKVPCTMMHKLVLELIRLSH